MRKSKNYFGIDMFRLLAALLVVAVHTSPLYSINPFADFLLTRILARLAVPFFFATSGFFLVKRYSKDTVKLQTFIKKTIKIYAISILIYLPLNIYAHYFSKELLLPRIIQDTVFNGTFYHLWYLPASIFGATITWFLIKKLDYKKSFCIVAFLYLIGLFGDSYYGIAGQFYTTREFYNLLFQIMYYTRNGLFFAPIFFWLGSFIAHKQSNLSVLENTFGFCVSLLLMTTEAIAVHHFNLPRHNSMYIFLAPCIFFLFNILLELKGKRIVWARDLSLIIYIIHPFMIVLVRLCAHILKLEGLFVENSIVHYFLVCAASLVFGLLFVNIICKYTKNQAAKPQQKCRAWIELNLDNLTHNLNEIKKALPANCQVMAVVKAEAYGHRIFEFSTHLEALGVKSFAVATIDEAILLRRFGINSEILILGYTDVRRAADLKRYNLLQTIIDFDYAKALNQQNIPVKAHLKIDTGMHRLGVNFDDLTHIKDIFSFKNIKILGIYSHFSSSETLAAEDVAFTQLQLNRFYSVLNFLKQNNISLPKTHIQSTYGLLNYPQIECNYVRLGLALYGILSLPDDKTKLQLNLKPVLSFKSKVVLLRDVAKDEAVGYDRAFVTERDTKLAMLPIGYADGLPRNFVGYVLINGSPAPIVGRICMDQLSVDVTDIPNVAVGDEVEIISLKSESNLLAPQIAKQCGSISNELLSRLGMRLDVLTV